MENSFTLPVTYKDKELEFPFEISASQYGHRFKVNVDGVEIVYEKDDAGEYRAVIYDQDKLQGKLPERGLLEAITAVIIDLAN